MYKKVTGSISVIVALCLLQASIASAADPSMVGWWKLNEGAGSVANDSSGSGNNGTLEGGPNWVAGQIRGGLELDGSDDHVDCGNGESLNITGEITIAAWVYPTGSGSTTYPRIVDKSSGTGGADAGYKMYLRTAEDYHVTLSGGGVYPISTGSVELNAWNYLVYISDGTQRKFFLNGEWERWSQSALPVVSDNPLFIGNSPAGARPFEGILDEVRVYNRALAEEEIEAIMWNLDEDTQHATDPSPAPEATDVPLDAMLSWTPGEFADTHDVYLGTVFDDVNNAGRANPLDVLVSQGQTDATYDPDHLELGQTYYWRVDEVNAAPDNTIFKGQVWSFTAEPFAYPVENIIATTSGISDAGAGPENTVNGSGLNENDEHSIEADDMWLATPNGADPITVQYEFDRIYKMHEMLVWNYNVQFELLLGFGIKNVTVEISENGADWTTLGDVELAQATAQEDYTANTAIDLGGAAIQYIRLTVNSGFGAMGQLGLSEVRLMYIPAHPREPQPADGATSVSLDSVLSWRAGRDAAAHEIYLSTDEAAVADGTALVDTVTTASYAPTNLEFGSMYYWKINEVNETQAITAWEGDLWSFTTQEYVVIDDMESYDDEENAIFDTWLDGFVNETGSTVGYFDAPFAEQTIVNSGSQSMPLEYVNDAAPFYSEAESDLGGMDIETNGADTLRLFVAGQVDNAVERFYVALEDTSGNVAVVTHPNPAAVGIASWQEWLIPYSELGGINLGSIATMYIGVGDRNNPTSGGTGLIFIDDIGYGRPAPVE